MTFHIVMDKHTDLDAISQEAARGDRPRHAMAMLRDQLDAVVHAPDPAATARLDDRVRSRLIGSPGTWALARRLAAQTGPGDVIFCGGEHSGFPVAAVAGGRKNGPRVAMMVHNVDRTRARVALRAFGLKRRADLIFSPSRPQIDFLGSAGIAANRRSFIYDQTDIRFFSPGAQGPKARPLVVSVGLEQRDYRTLAEATAGLDLDVRISGFSTDAALLAETFPETMPANFHQSFYEWRDLAQLYRDADVVVVAVRPNRYAAGVQALVEGGKGGSSPRRGTIRSRMSTRSRRRCAGWRAGRAGGRLCSVTLNSIRDDGQGEGSVDRRLDDSPMVERLRAFGPYQARSASPANSRWS